MCMCVIIMKTGAENVEEDDWLAQRETLIKARLIYIMKSQRCVCLVHTHIFYHSKPLLYRRRK